eukprot:1242271-Amphidinium_carterae.1
MVDVPMVQTVEKIVEVASVEEVSGNRRTEVMMLPAVRKTANVEFVEVTETGAPLPTIAETPQYVEDFK